MFLYIAESLFFGVFKNLTNSVGGSYQVKGSPLLFCVFPSHFWLENLQVRLVLHYQVIRSVPKL